VTVSAEIRQRLADAIHTGQLAPGTPLPAERVLCQEFGVARTSVREAIQGLVIAGFIERRGNRSVVAERLPDVNFTGDDRKTLVTQLFEVRQVIEPAIAELAARRATDEQREQIADIAARMTTDLEIFRDLDHQFHSALARACGNPLLNEVHSKALAALFRSGDLASLLFAEVNRSEVNDIISSSMTAHQTIAEAVVKGHTRKAVAAVVAHLDDVERRMVERLL
jgi:GntR family transcriptional repressor for pyruvate dehydrogenase complex